MILRHTITQALWLVPLTLQIGIVAVMLWRELAKVFPVFFAYTVGVVLRDLVLLFIPYATNLYSLVYWSGEGLAVILGLGVILEIVQRLVRPFHFLKPVLTAIWILGGMATLMALAILAFSNSGTGADRVLESIVQLERALRFLQVSLLIVMITLMSRLKLTWHQYSVGIIAGFGIYAALDLAALEFRAHLHFLSNAGFVLLRPAAYNLGAIIWASYFLRPRAPKSPAPLPNAELAECNDALTDYLEQWYQRY